MSAASEPQTNPESMLQQVRFVLVRSQHAGNIGAAARAMKNMGITDLHLIQPREFPHPQATAMAAGAGDLLDRAVVHEGLADALTDCGRVFAATARDRRASYPAVSTPELADRVRVLLDQPIAIVFGPERTGLCNSDLDLCHEIVSIPASPIYPSMNLAGAVQVIAYALRSGLSEVTPAADARNLPSHQQMESLHAHLASMVSRLGFLDQRSNPEQALRRLRVLFNRAAPDHKEVQLLRGLLTSMDQHLDKH